MNEGEKEKFMYDKNPGSGSSAFEHCTPESVGVSSMVVLRCLKELEACGTDMHGFVLYRKGKIIAETSWRPYAKEIPHTNHSMGKSYTAAAIGIACGEGILSLQDKLADIFAGELDRWSIHPSPKFRSIKIKHLLSMSAGMEHMPPLTDNWILDYLRSEPVYEPGSHFLYDTSGSSLLGAIIEKRSGMGLKEYLTDRMFRKIGIDSERFIWLKFPNGCYAEPGTCATDEDNLRLGLLYMNYGCWNGEQIIPRDWVEQATSFQVSTSGEIVKEARQGYGYQLWLCSTPETYRFDGGQGQYCVFSRSSGLVASLHEGASVPEIAPRVLDILLENLFSDELPESLPEDTKAQLELLEYLASRSVRKSPVCCDSKTSRKFSGVYIVREGDPNPWIEVCPGGVNFFSLFYDRYVNPAVEKIEIIAGDDECRIVLNDRSVFRGRFDGEFRVCDTKNVLPLQKTCCNAYMEGDKLCMDLRWLNGWFGMKMEFTLSEDGNRLDIAVYKDTLNEMNPVNVRRGWAQRMIR